MDLSTAASNSGSSGPVAAPSSSISGSNSNSSTSSSGGGGGGDSAVACPVCTLYLREGISLQKHLDTHPKEQVIEALIRASGSGGVGGGVSALFGQQQQQQPPQPPPPAPTPSPAPTPTTAQPPAASPSPHVSHAPSPFPIGPIYHECPPLNAMIPPAQFASFSYQQFVNNGTMMIPAQYAMAQAQPPQTSQMMQMLYNPYGMYHQQQIPTVQMISAPPMMPTSTSTMPTTMPSVTTRMRPTATSTSNVTITPVSEPTVTSMPLPAPTSRPSSVQSQPQSLVVEPPKQQPTQEIVAEPESILPHSNPASPEPQQDEPEESHSDLPVEHSDHQNGCAESEERHDVEQYQRVDPPILVSNEVTDDDKTETILPDMRDDGEIESLIVRDSSKIQNVESNVVESAEPMDTTVEQSPEKATVETTQSDHEESDRQSPSETPERRKTIVRASDILSMSDKEIEAPSSSRPEMEKLNQLLVNMEADFSNVELSSRFVEESTDRVPCEEQNDSIDEPTDKNVDEDESTSVSYLKIAPEQNECKIIVAHDESDVSSIASSDLECDSQVRKPYHKILHSRLELHSRSDRRSAPPSPAPTKTLHHRSTSRASIHADFDRSSENLNAYPIGFEATSLRDGLKDNYSDADMELEEPNHHTFMEQNDDLNDKPKDLSTNVDSMKARRSRLPGSPVSIHSSSSYDQLDDEEDDSDLEDDDEEDEDDEEMLMDAVSQRTNDDDRDSKKAIHREDCKAVLGIEINRQKDQSIDFRSQSIMADNYSAAQFPLNLGPTSQQRQPSTALHHETYPLSNSATSQNLLNISESADPTTSTDSKSCSSSNKSTIQKPSAELLNINEDAHAGPMNVFEFDGLQILVPSTFISESSQKAVSGTSQQSMSSSENGAGNDEEVKSVNMRADETMPPRGELSEQESNGCTEQSAWQLYMGQESSRMSTSYDLMARESWEESEGSDHEENNAGPLLDSRSLATHFTSSLFLDRDRDRKTPTRQLYKCFHCPDVFECPKERRVHSTMVHKESGPSSSNDNMDQQDLKEIKVLDSRTTVFDDLFATGIHAPQIYHQQPLLHQLQPPQQNAAKVDGESKIDGLHLPTMEVMCSLCNQRFTSEKSLQIHHRRIHDADAKRVRETTKCQTCNEEFTSVASYNLHLKIHPLECGQCGKYFYRKQNFKLHMKRHLGIKPFQCTMCDKAFLTKQKLDEHMNGHTGNAPVKCNLCNETFRRYSNLTQHKNRHHLNIKKKLKDYICHCGEVFHTKKKLAWHKETHDDKPKSCTYCNERFVHMASLTRHMRRAHNRRFVPDAQRDSENVECPICKCIYLRSSLPVHMRVHNGEKPYTCQMCPKSFSTKWNLQLHKWTHASRNSKPFKCAQCNAAFYRQSDYTAHMNSHRNVRPYTCNYCGAQFIRKYNCLRHVKEHEENKQYTCDVCNKAFHRSYYLKEHLRVHSGQRPHTCHICGKTSSTKSNHNKHVRIHHAREPVNTEN